MAWKPGKIALNVRNSANSYFFFCSDVRGLFPKGRPGHCFTIFDVASATKKQNKQRNLIKVPRTLFPTLALKLILLHSCQKGVLFVKPRLWFASQTDSRRHWTYYWLKTILTKASPLGGLYSAHWQAHKIPKAGPPGDATAYTRMLLRRKIGPFSKSLMGSKRSLSD